ncbi:MAG: TlpA family protein disulfide reductase [Candidatus Promineifilaceae bacterium]|jgi:cytochrome c biogenesis protein CcmG/thiol:disulfide interchange protein DsbE
MSSHITQTPIEGESTETDPTTVGEQKSGKIRWTMIALWAAVIGLLALLGWGLMKTNTARPEPGQAAPYFDVEFFNGYEWEDRTVADLDDMRGNVVVLNFWASWCVECRLEADLIEDTWRKYADDDVVFLGVAYADVEPNSISYLDDFGITYPNAPDLGTDISDTYEITGVPETFFIGKDGVIEHVQIGPLNQATMDKVIQKLLQEEGA